MCKKTFVLITLLLVLGLVNSVSATTFYVDPVSGSMANNGSEGSPWSTLEAVFDNNKIETKDKNGNPKNSGAPVKAGDTLLLLSGYHGDIYESVYFNDDYITIEAKSGHTAELKRFRLSGGKKWIIRGLDISPSNAETFERVTMVEFYSRTADGICSDMTIEDCDVYTIADSSGWSANDWDTKACNGIILGMEGGSGLLAKNNYLLNVNHGICTQAQYSTAEENIIENFSGDGVRATYHDVVVKYNLIMNCYNVNDNHDDGIQTFLVNVGAGAVYRVNLIGNIIINTSNPSQSYQGGLQGIGIFDGPHYDFVIENNLVCTNHWHGITLLNSQNAKIVNNTVFSKWYYDYDSDMNTWIRITEGSTNGGNLVRNNIAHTFDTSGDSSATVDNNLTFSRTSDDPADWFVNYSTFDMHTDSSSSPQVDDGSSSEAPSTDIEGTSRPQGSYYDVGAYEYTSGGDTTAPSPNPMTWSTEPYATGTTSISMTATTATDSSGVEYSFDCTAGGGNDSGWQDSTTYEDTGLSASTQYTYRVKARDKSANQNETAYSTTKSATTDSVEVSPVSWWKLDESSGTNADDSSGNNHDGTRSGGSWAPTSGKFDGAVDLGDANSDHVEVPTTSMSASAGTVSVWGRIEGTQSGERYFFGHTSGSGPAGWADRMQIYMDNDDNQLDLGLGGSHTTATNIQTLSANTWYHVALTWDGGDYVVYVDGIQKASGTYTGLSTLNSIADIGNTGNTTYRYGAFQGLLDEVLIYDQALSQYDVADLAGITIASNPSPADEATGVSTTADLSWSAGYYAASTNGHDVYLGTNYNSVADANHSSSEFKGNQTATTYDPGTMSASSTYYWAIDEVNDSNTWPGDVWSFTTESVSGTHIDATFDSDADGFTYADITNGSYVDGSWNGSYGYSGGGIRVRTGPGPTGGATDGQYSDGFNLSSAGWVKITLRYRLEMGEGFESNEYGEAYLMIDSTRYGDGTGDSLVRIVGNGNGGGTDDSGWLSGEFNVSLSSGSHTIKVGAYNNASTAGDEWVNAYFDNVKVEDTSAPAGDVELVGSWVAGTSHSAEGGNDRVLVLTAHAEDDDSAMSITSVTYGGKSMTKVIEQNTAASGYHAYIGAFILNDADIDDANGSSFVVIWQSNPFNTPNYGSAFFANVKQSDPNEAEAGNYNTSNDTVSTSALGTNDGDMVIVAATCGNTGSYAVNNGFTKGVELTITSADGVTGHKAASGSNETPSVTFTSGANRQAILGFILNKTD